MTPGHFSAQPVNLQIVSTADSRIATGHSAFRLDGHFIWGASVLQSVEDGKYYMVYSAPESEVYPFNDAWVYGSKMGLAVSDRPDGGFQQVGFFLNEDGFAPDTSAWDAQTVMNPHLRRFGDKYYLYYVGARDAGDLPVKTSSGTLDRRSRIQQMLRIGVIEFDSFAHLMEGKFVRSDQPLLTPRTRVKPNDIVDPSPEGTQPKPDNIIVVNPSVVYRPSDQKYLLYFKGNLYDPHWRGVHGVALADTPTGPFIPLDSIVFNLPTADGAKQSAEDPYVWYNRKEKLFYAVFKDFTGHFTQADPCLALMYSEDGIDWKLPAHSRFMKKELVLTSGDTIQVDRLERPQFLLNAEDDPLVLYSACSIDELNGKRDGSSFNVQIPLKRE
ncbi:MAG: glycoside hydrolase family protein, partial [Parabacteroides sp.]